MLVVAGRSFGAVANDDAKKAKMYRRDGGTYNSSVSVFLFFFVLPEEFWIIHLVYGVVSQYIIPIGL